LNCAGVPDSLLESELFGHVRGSFTGADRDRAGLLDQAPNGTLFLDEIGEMSPRMQDVLLRFLESGELQRVGADRPHACANVRLVAATNRNLPEQIAAGAFREDLHFRGNVVPMTLPPLRERSEDIPLFVDFFLRTHAAAHKVEPVRMIRDYSYCSERFYGRGYLLAGDAACFIDPIFSTGVHLACLSGYLSARAVTAIHQGGDEVVALSEYDAQYRAAFNRYLDFLYFFYDHHSDPDSYFWTARKILNSEHVLETRTAFVRLMSGNADVGALNAELTSRHTRLANATARGRFGLTREAQIFRVRETEQRLRREND
jgi:2-polyprenyl-6-methoxyphenol hydroxylase-like FAD-dependent oxidoreductase